MIIEYSLIILFGLGFAYFSYRKPSFALAFILLTLSSYQIRFNVGPLPMTLLELMILILFFAWLIPRLMQRKEIFWGNYRWLLLAWLGVALFSAIVSPDLRAALGVWKAYFVEAAMVYLLLINLGRDSKKLDLMLNFLLLGAMLMSIWAIVQRFTGLLVPYQYWYLGEGPRATGFFGVPNFLGLYVGPLVGLALGRLIYAGQRWGWYKIFYLATVILGFVAIVLARSEGAVVAVVAAGFILALANIKTRVLAATIMLIIVALYFGSPQFHNAVLSRIDPGQNWSVFVRTQIWSESWQMLKDNWLLGAGLSGYQSAVAPYHQAGYMEIFLYPHNILMNFWSEMGFAGLALFVVLMLKFFIEAYRAWRQRIKLEYLWPAVLAMSIIIIHGLVDHPFFKNDLAIIFWIPLALITIINLFVNNKQVENES